MKARRAKSAGSASKKLSQQHRDKISKALKAYHAGRKKRKPVNDNLAGTITRKPRESFKSRRTPVFQNRNLEAGHLRDLRKTNRSLVHALQTKRLTDVQAGIKAQKRFKRKTRIRKFLAKFLPKNIGKLQ